MSATAQPPAQIDAGQSKEAARSKWEAADEDDLRREVQAYRNELDAVKQKLLKLGEAVPDEDDNKRLSMDSDGDLAVEDLDPSEWQVPEHCIPIRGDVREVAWEKLAGKCQFDVIMMDPPWQLATANPTRGVALGYQQLCDKNITDLPVQSLQTDGFIFVWVINAKYKMAIDMLKNWGYDLVDEIVWVKLTVNRRLAKSHGYYLQHAKEVCLVGKKGKDPPGMRGGLASDIIFAERRGQSQKPTEIYEIIEQLVPNGKYLEIFGRKNNLRNFWVTVGNEVCGWNHLADLAAKAEADTDNKEVVVEPAGEPAQEAKVEP
eukprot:scaffold1906_cov403-Prasinococcus_capsulatus_cf.AAC.7